jgi:hypothetical protein
MNPRVLVDLAQWLWLKCLMKRSDEPFVCPNCGEEVPAGAAACPGCGADEKTGWSENTVYDGTDIADPDGEEFDHEAWLRRERGQSPRHTGSQWIVWFVAVLLLALAVYLMLHSG